MMHAPAVVPVLMYHQIAGRDETKSHLAVSPAAFAAQLGRLAAAGYRTMTAAGLAAALADPAARRPDRAVVLTFDDGFADFHSRALPLLAQYGFTATVFMTTGWIADAGPLAAEPRPGRMLSWRQLSEVAAAGVEVGAHSHTHAQLDQLPDRLLRRELEGSKALLEDRLGRPVPGLAYPFGYSSARVRRAARAAGHDYACAVGNVLPGPAPDRFALPRLTVRRSTSLRAFDQMVAGRLPVIFLKDRSLTRGYAMVRRTRAALSGVARGT